MASRLTLQYLDRSQWNIWDDFLKKSCQGTVFQTSSFIQSITKAFKRPAEIIAVFRGGQIIGGVVLYPQKRWHFEYAISPFFAPYNGFLIDNFEETALYYKRIKYQQDVLWTIQRELENRFVFTVLYQSPYLEDLRTLVWNRWQFIPQYSAVIDLQRPDDLTNRVQKDQRRRLRNFERSDYSFVEADNLIDIFELVRQSYSHHGLHPPLGQQQYLNFARELMNQKLARCFAICRGEKLLSGLLVVEAYPGAYALFSGKNFQERESAAELFLIWKSMQYYQERGFRWLDLIGAMVPSIAKVKLELGARLLRYDQTNYFRNRLFQVLFYLNQRRKQAQRKL